MKKFKSDAELVNILSWITAFIWLIPYLGQWVEIILNAVKIFTLVGMANQSEYLLKFFLDEDNYIDLEMFKKTMGDRLFYYKEFDKDRGTDVA